MTKLVLCSEPHACAQTAVQENVESQMRMTDKGTPHAPKIMLTSIGPLNKGQETLYSRITTTGLIDLDRVRTTHGHFVGSFPLFALDPLVDVVAGNVCAFSRCTFLIASSRSSSTIDRTPSRNSRTHRNTIPMPLRQGVDDHPLVWYPSAPRPQCLHAPPDHA